MDGRRAVREHCSQDPAYRSTRPPPRPRAQLAVGAGPIGATEVVGAGTSEPVEGAVAGTELVGRGWVALPDKLGRPDGDGAGLDGGRECVGVARCVGWCVGVGVGRWAGPAPVPAVGTGVGRTHR